MDSLGAVHECCLLWNARDVRVKEYQFSSSMSTWVIYITGKAEPKEGIYFTLYDIISHCSVF